MTLLRDLQGLIVDMDGVLYRGNTPIAGAAEFLAWLTARQFPYLLLTNNSTLDPQAYERKLASMGITVPAVQIMTSGLAAAEHLARHFAPQARVFMIGESGLETCIRERGFTITDERPEVVVVGMDRQINYAKLRTAMRAIRAGAPFIATNPDRTLPAEEGEVPGAGSIIAAVAAATDRAPLMIGKPEAPMIEMALDRLGQPRERVAMLGDRLETDILGGRRRGLPTILVLSGISQQAPPPDSDLQPDWVFADVGELRDAWQRSLEQQD